jgi:acyl carrier protein
MDGRQLIAELLGRSLPPVSDETQLQSLGGWDSLKLVQLVVRLETLASRELSEQELEDLQTVGQVEKFFR